MLAASPESTGKLLASKSLLTNRRDTYVRRDMVVLYIILKLINKWFAKDSRMLECIVILQMKPMGLIVAS